MTVANVEGNGDVVPYDPSDLDSLGLGDVTSSDLTMPRLTINHPDGLFKNNLTGEEFPVLRAVMLGIVKQRVFWDSDVDEGDKPLCKSPDFEHGFPNMNYDGKTPPNKQFPWARSNFDPADFPAENGVNGLVTLPCENCVFKEWDKGDWKQPPCNEQHTYPLLYQTEEGDLMPALISLQRTGIKPSRTYVNSFVQARRPMFTVFTEIALTQQSRGTVRYSVPSFRKKEATDENQWAEFAEMYKSAREFVRRAPRNDDEAEALVTGDNVNRGPDPTSAPSATVPASSPVATAQPSPSAPQAAVTTPTTTTTKPTAAAAPATTPGEAASTAPQAAPQTTTPSDGPEDLPF